MFISTLSKPPNKHEICNQTRTYCSKKQFCRAPIDPWLTLAWSLTTRIYINHQTIVHLYGAILNNLSPGICHYDWLWWILRLLHRQYLSKPYGSWVIFICGHQHVDYGTSFTHSYVCTSTMLLYKIWTSANEENSYFCSRKIWLLSLLSYHTFFGSLGKIRCTKLDLLQLFYRQNIFSPIDLKSSVKSLLLSWVMVMGSVKMDEYYESITTCSEPCTIGMGDLVVARSLVHHKEMCNYQPWIIWLNLAHSSLANWLQTA